MQRPEKQTKKSALKKFVVNIFTMSTEVKHTEIPCKAEILHRDITLQLPLAKQLHQKRFLHHF